VGISDVAHAVSSAKPVVVVGLGSTGSALAARLAKLGTPVVALEQYGRAVQGRVYDVAPSTLDMFAHWGIADELGVRAGTASRASTDMGALLHGIDGTDPRAWLHVSKDAIDEGLRAVARDNGAELLTGTTFERVEHTADGVRVFASGLDQPIEGSMLVFADGGRDASREALGYGTTTFPERARYIGGWFDQVGLVDAAKASRMGVDGFAFRVPDERSALAWARVPDGFGELADAPAKSLRGDDALGRAATSFIEERAPAFGASGRARDLAVADVQLRLVDGVVDQHGSIGLGDLVAGVPFDRSQGFNAGVLEAERAAQHVQAVLAGGDRAALGASYQSDVLEGARRLVDQARASLGESNTLASVA
jgi:2-polyprenyl-6-methoxyphenol hydroxylase-like FAD-dependent oxidoreductase